MLAQKPTLNGEFSVYKLRQNSSKAAEVLADDSSPHDEFGPLDSDALLHSAEQHSFSEKGASHHETWQATSQNNSLKSDSLRSTTDSDIQSDEPSPPARHKVVAIDTSRNKHFTRRLLPVQSPEFDNVMDQVIKRSIHSGNLDNCMHTQARIDRQKFSTEGFVRTAPNAAGAAVRVAAGASNTHSSTLETGDVMKAATEDLLRIFQLKVLVFFPSLFYVLYV